MHVSTPPMARTACTESQCLYKGDLYLSTEPAAQCTCLHPLWPVRPVQNLSACTRVTFTLVLSQQHNARVYENILNKYLTRPRTGAWRSYLTTNIFSVSFRSVFSKSSSSLPSSSPQFSSSLCLTLNRPIMHFLSYIYSFVPFPYILLHFMFPYYLIGARGGAVS